jgi:membrane-bound lytic murein transglycosylase A
MNVYRFLLLINLVLLTAACAVWMKAPMPPPVDTTQSVATAAPPPPAAVPLPMPECPAPPVQQAAGPACVDDLDLASLETAIEQSLKYYEGAREPLFSFGNRMIPTAEFKASLLAFRDIIRSPDSTEIKIKKITDCFDFIPSRGQNDKGTVIFTGYYVPVLEGSPVRTSRYRYPLYRKPDDLIFADLGKFNIKYKSDQLSGRLANGELIPYYSRDDIDRKGMLTGRHLEFLWVDDPVALYSLHVQGSGKIRMPDGKLIMVSYAQSNGRAFRPISKTLIENGKMTIQDVSYQRIQDYLKAHPDEIHDLFSKNERYVFFRKVARDPEGALRLPVTSGRTIATDPDVYPRGALALIRTRKPQFDEQGQIKKWVPFSRFVLNQDAGTAIKGPGRVDVFCGDGPDAEQLAGSLKEKGDIYILLRKK